MDCVFTFRVKYTDHGKIFAAKLESAPDPKAGVACGKFTMMFYQYGKTSWVPVMFCHFWHNITNGDHDVFPYPMMFSNFPSLVL